MNIYEELLEMIGDPQRVSINESVLEQHSKGITYHTGTLPDVVVFPVNKTEVVQIVNFAATHKIPIVPFGVGSSLEGHIVPQYGGITISFSLMNQILDVSPQDFSVTVQPGVTREQLNKHIKRHGLFFPIDPGADATIGGMTATNASGTNAVKYGVMRNQILKLEVVLADGRIIQTGSSAIKTSAGYSLKDLFIGSEGTLGIITEIKLRLRGIPEAIIAARATFQSLEDAGRAAVHILSAGIDIGKIELVDSLTIKAVNEYMKTSYEEAPTLFLECSGTENEVEYQLEMIKECIASSNSRSFQTEKDSKKRAQLWEARHKAGLAVIAAYPGELLMATDVCVPISKLPEAIHKAREIVNEHNIQAAIFGHIGDGNFHVTLTVDPNNPDSLRRAETVNEKLVHYALEQGGTCTGEHGIGMGKTKYLRLEHGEAVDVMEDIKQLFDPHFILNPGKIVNHKTHNKSESTSTV
ncbi:FAD-binding oxidoreductase [Aneurinibacillus tyrosinisolvens]|uniref:FAD-binding oxidoreductase n=1 Tax=Aneurinibacillus tyrosinisolvens TaxID=1443435 RepID=UPI00063F171F|nr:FAD-linked oxidase C-terminal domain-containing protein [Aneurinibacillus tyrosinisolvens]